MALVVKSTSSEVSDMRDTGPIPGSGRSTGGDHGNPLQCSCLENPMDRGAWQATVYRVTKSWTWLKQLCMHACTHTHTHIYIYDCQNLKLSTIPKWCVGTLKFEHPTPKEVVLRVRSSDSGDPQNSSRGVWEVKMISILTPKCTFLFHSPFPTNMWGSFPEVPWTERMEFLWWVLKCVLVLSCVLNTCFNLWTNINRHKHVIIFKYKKGAWDQRVWKVYAALGISVSGLNVSL